MHPKTFHACVIDTVLSTGLSPGLLEAFQSYCKYFFVCSYSYLLTVLSARSRIFSALNEGLLIGQLEIKDRGGIHLFGKPRECRPIVRMDVHNDQLWIRIALSIDLGCMSF